MTKEIESIFILYSSNQIQFKSFEAMYSMLPFQYKSAYIDMDSIHVYCENNASDISSRRSCYK